MHLSATPCRSFRVGNFMKYPVMCSGGVATNGSGSPHGGISSAHSGAHSGNGGEKRKSSKHQSQGDSSPLDALFQMASKTFEGLKAKSGKTFLRDYFLLYSSKVIL